VRRILAVVVACFAACQSPEPDLSTTEQLAVVASPLSYDFGSLTVGQTSNAVAFQIRPSAGAQYDTLIAVNYNCPDFVLSLPGLPADVIREVECESCPLCAAPVCYTIYTQNYDWSARFRPTVGAPVSCPVTFMFSNSASNKTVTLSGTGVLPPIDIDVQPGSMGFGDVRVNTQSGGRTLTVRNAGGQTLTVTGMSVPAGYAMTGSTSYTVPAGGAVSHTVTCTPPAVGPRNGTLTITSNDPATPSIGVPLSCNGTDSALDISPSPIALPPTRVGEPLERTITLSNGGGASMVLSSVTLTGTDLELVSAPAANLTLAPGQTTTAIVRFKASASGDATGTLDAMYDGRARSSDISARALTTSIAITPDGTVELGPVCIGQQKEQTFSVIANAEASFVVNAISTPAEPFTVSGPALPATVQGAGANSVTFSVTAAPAATGHLTSTFEVTTDIPGSTPKTIELGVDGLTAGVSGTPELLDFGSAEPGTTSIGQPVHVSNCGTSPITMANPRIEGANAAEFAIVANPASPTIEPTGTASWLVISSIDSVGLKEAAFVVDYEGGTVTIPLAAEGLGDGVLGGVGDDVRPSYYACSAGSASAAWPIGLAVLGLLRRRRRV